MNTPITFPPPEPELKLARPPAEKWAATLTEERRRLQEDQESLREREQNLREYEARLRALQAELEAGRTVVVSANGAPRTATAHPYQRPSSRTPFHDDPALQAAWEKLHRAREILEAEQSHLRDDRIAVREYEQALRLREEAIAQREQQLAEHEAQLTASTPPEEVPVPVVNEETPSAVTRFTRAPFNLARAMLGKKAAS